MLAARVRRVVGLLRRPSTAAVVTSVRELLRQAGLADTPGGWGVTDVEAVVAAAARSERWANNPVVVGEDEAVAAVHGAFGDG